ncbi:acetyltransferase [Marinobacterium nitratireducens]|uniref:Acetyltransferase n=1 Tax=Marinobacterium nitratireducens TaxID=518897 RepID=A0A917ZCD8_9GAMM|nr:GNAT family N-acetyltransferase [Marinobacterium nitratireducens]GGO80780.1 acetyltransferase [Marinobacterium nitratireducens]
MRLEWYPFEHLGVDALYALLRLRAQVFVVEQECAYADVDGLDPQAHHLLGWGEDGLVACARVFPPQQGRIRVGRILVEASARGDGAGHRLVEEILRFCRCHWPGVPLALAAQAHLERFYGQHGFIAESEPYDEDGILHIDMLRPVQAPAPLQLDDRVS